MNVGIHNVKKIHVKQDRHWSGTPSEFHNLKISLETEQGWHEIDLFSHDGPMTVINPEVRIVD